jgi:hypothetical protein
MRDCAAVLGARTSLGRWFTREDEPAAVIGYRASEELAQNGRPAPLWFCGVPFLYGGAGKRALCAWQQLFHAVCGIHAAPDAIRIRHSSVGTRSGKRSRAAGAVRIATNNKEALAAVLRLLEVPNRRSSHG